MGKENIESRKSSYLFVEFWLWFGIVVVLAIYSMVVYLDRIDDTNVGTIFVVVSYLLRGLISVALVIKVVKMREFKRTIRFSMYLVLLFVALVIFFFPFLVVL